MAVRKTSPKKAAVKETPKAAKRTISFSIPNRFSQQQILYTLLLVAVFLVGYLVATVQAMKTAPAAPTGGTAAAGAQQPAAADPNKVYDVSAGHFPVRGNKDAKVTVIEFADFRCPFCEKFFTDVEPQLIKDYVDTGKIKFAYRHYAFLGPASTVAGNAAECAQEQDHFWDMYEYLYKNQPAETDTTMYNSDTLSQAAGTLGMDQAQFKSCMDANKYQKNIDTDMADGQKASVNATPTFFVNGKQLLGAQPYDSFKTLIEAELKK